MTHSFPRPVEPVPQREPVVVRTLLSFYPPPEPLSLPALPSPPRQPAFHATHTLSTHIVPAAYLRTSRDVPILSPPPDSLSKAERKIRFKEMSQELLTIRPPIDTQGHPKVLYNCVNRYVRKDLDSSKPTGITLLLAHANGFPKETWEPTLQHLFSSPASHAVDEVWAWEAVQHGDAGLLNKSSLGGIYDWSDNARDILNFLINYLPSSASSSTFPTHLTRQPKEESEDRRNHGFRYRSLITVGHSFGGCTSTLAALTYPKLFASLILADPVIYGPIHKVDAGNENRLAFGALQRRDAWDSRDEALKLFSQNPFFAAWDAEVLKLYVECGLYLTQDANGNEVARLKMSGMQEAIVFSDWETGSEVWQRLPELDERIDIRWVMPGKPGADEFGPPGARGERVWRRPNNASNVILSSVGHLIPQEAPKELAAEIRDVVIRRWRPSVRASL